jgi:hypothetical protein
MLRCNLKGRRRDQRGGRDDHAIAADPRHLGVNSAVVSFSTIRMSIASWRVGPSGDSIGLTAWEKNEAAAESRDGLLQS